jgi:hypothetical protein
LHQDVRVAAIPESLVGYFLSKEEFNRQWADRSGCKPRIQEDQSQGTSSAVGQSATDTAALNPHSSQYFQPHIFHRCDWTGPAGLPFIYPNGVDPKLR